MKEPSPDSDAFAVPGGEVVVTSVPCAFGRSTISAYIASFDGGKTWKLASPSETAFLFEDSRGNFGIGFVKPEGY